MIRVYRVPCGEDIDMICGLDREMLDGSYLEGDTEIEVRYHRVTTLAHVKSGILSQWSELGDAITERLVAYMYPRRPLMGRARNQTAYAVLGRELLMVTAQNAYLQRPGIRIGSEVVARYNR